MNKPFLTKKQLSQLTGAQPYTIYFLYETGRLPTIRGSLGPGRPILFDLAAVGIVKEYLKRRDGR